MEEEQEVEGADDEEEVEGDDSENTAQQVVLCVDQLSLSTVKNLINVRA